MKSIVVFLFIVLAGCGTEPEIKSVLLETKSGKFSLGNAWNCGEIAGARLAHSEANLDPMWDRLNCANLRDDIGFSTK